MNPILLAPCGTLCGIIALILLFQFLLQENWLEYAPIIAPIPTYQRHYFSFVVGRAEIVIGYSAEITTASDMLPRIVKKTLRIF